MKFNGEVPGPNVATLYLPRGDDKVLCIKAGAVLSYEEFHKTCPLPKPPMKRAKGATQAVPDFDHKDYVAAMDSYGKWKSQWMVLQSLKATPEISWDTIVPTDPLTFGNYEKELEEAGFSEFERQRILGIVMEANALNDRKIDEARETFLSALDGPKQ